MLLVMYYSYSCSDPYNVVWGTIVVLVDDDTVVRRCHIDVVLVDTVFRAV